AVPVYYASSDGTIAAIDRSSGYVRAFGPSTVTFSATALIDGVVQHDTLAYIFGPSHGVNITTDVQNSAGGGMPALTFAPSTVTVGAGWTVTFKNPTTDTVDVVFTDSTRGVNGIVVGRYAESDTEHTGPISAGILNEVFF